MAAEVFMVFFAAVLVNNFVLKQFLGICPYIGVSKDLKSAAGMGVAVIFVMTVASMVTWLVYHYLLAPGPANVWYRLAGNDYVPGSFDLTVLTTIAFVLVIAALVQFVEMVIQKTAPALYRALGIYLPLITTNCAVLGVALLNINAFFTDAGPVPGSFLKSVCQGLGAGAGFTLAL
ncbi:MAG TPA: Rnf-Nqr domain containing protein, partial [bacterium]|nr:Rnf-Nqr domain containing protein [bacterium]